MTLSTITRQLKLSAFTLVACVAIAVLSADQASAQSFSGNRGFSGNSGRGISLNVGRVGLSLGFNGNNGFSNNFRKPPVPVRSASFGRPAPGCYGNRGGYTPSPYGRGGRSGRGY